MDHQHNCVDELIYSKAVHVLPICYVLSFVALEAINSVKSSLITTAGSNQKQSAAILKQPNPNPL